MQNIAVLYDASQAVLSTFDLDEVLRRILCILRDYFHLQNVAILLSDEAKRELSVHSQIGWDEGSDKVVVALGQGITGNAAKLKRPVYVPNVSQDARYVANSHTTRSELAIPLMVRDEVVGVLDCQSENVDHFDTTTTDLLILFSTQASIALQNARLHSLEQRRSRQLRAINAIAQQTTAVLEMNELLSRVCSLIKDAFQVHHVSVLLQENNEVVLVAHVGTLTSLFKEGERFSGKKGPWAQAIQSGSVVTEDDVRDIADYLGFYRETRARICIPLITFGQTVGALVLEHMQPRAFENAEMEPLESVADICATAIQNAQYVERMRQLAYIDGLTGIFNRRFFEMRIAEEIERSQRFNTGLAVIMVDIDRFKLLNDEFGHLLGDEVLRQVSSVFHQQLRKIDVACRYGGEEFAILLAQTSPEQALVVAEKLRQQVEGWQFPGVPRPVTISVGTACCPLHGKTRDDLVKAADTGLYFAKQAGRNQVCQGPLANVKRAGVK
jgi:diguanylate cyclase (GGDEF)-like protein